MPPHIAVIGAGLSGLAATSYLCAEGLKVTVLEQRTRPGGLWNADDDLHEPKRWYRPVYHNLETNIPRQMMTLSDHPWTSNTPVMPHHRIVKEYLRSYAAELFRKYKDKEQLRFYFNASVVAVRQGTENKTLGWKVPIELTGANLQTTNVVQFFDAVVVAVGNYTTPKYLPCPGLDDWRREDQDSIVHALHYQGADDFRDMNVLVVGYGPSGFDISAKIATKAKVVVASSTRPAQGRAPGVHIMMPEIQSMDVSQRSVTFKNGSVFSPVDKIVYCTGYSYGYDFIQKPNGRNGHVLLLPGGDRVDVVYLDILDADIPTLAFIGVPTSGLSFIIAEAQSAVVARVFAGRLAIPSRSVMKHWIEGALKERNVKVRNGNEGIASFHSYASGADKVYVNLLYDLCQTGPRKDGVVSKPPPFWCGCLDSARDQAAAVRATYKAHDCARIFYNSYESLGAQLPVSCNPSELPQPPTSEGYASCYTRGEVI